MMETIMVVVVAAKMMTAAATQAHTRICPPHTGHMHRDDKMCKYIQDKWWIFTSTRVATNLLYFTTPGNFLLSIIHSSQFTVVSCATICP